MERDLIDFLVHFEDATVLAALGGCIFCCDREHWATPLTRYCGELLLVGLQTPANVFHAL
jgi:hypothetical protein